MSTVIVKPVAERLLGVVVSFVSAVPVSMLLL